MGEMAIMGREGDTKIIWDPDKNEEVDNAKATFDRLVKKGKYAAFSVTDKGDKDEKVTKFDKNYEKLIFVPPIAGG